MEFVAVKRVAYQDQNGDNQLDALKLSLKYANKQENMKLVFLDSEHAGDFSWEFNEAGEAATYYYILGSMISGPSIWS